MSTLVTGLLLSLLRRHSLTNTSQYSSTITTPVPLQQRKVDFTTEHNIHTDSMIQVTSGSSLNWNNPCE